ncbi:MAG: hypothetical protein QXR73_00270, partial [Candidatus Micrarchaeaceae archaeon]
MKKVFLIMLIPSIFALILNSASAFTLTIGAYTGSSMNPYNGYYWGYAGQSSSSSSAGWSEGVYT